MPSRCFEVVEKRRFVSQNAVAKDDDFSAQPCVQFYFHFQLTSCYRFGASKFTKLTLEGSNSIYLLPPRQYTFPFPFFWPPAKVIPISV